jgi:hypothetical protein
VTAPGAGDARGAPDALRAEFERRKAVIRAMPDKEAAVRAAGDLVTESALFRGEAARLRTEMAEEWRASEGLTLQQAADRLGVKLGTLQKLLERDKRAEREREKQAARKRERG